jgi:hypothetical protein
MTRRKKPALRSRTISGNAFILAAPDHVKECIYNDHENAMKTEITR